MPLLVEKSEQPSEAPLHPDIDIDESIILDKRLSTIVPNLMSTPIMVIAHKMANDGHSNG